MDEEGLEGYPVHLVMKLEWVWSLDEIFNEAWREGVWIEGAHGSRLYMLVLIKRVTDTSMFCPIWMLIGTEGPRLLYRAPLPKLLPPSYKYLFTSNICMQDR
ncbi:hypothetical protein G7K_5072-t1 [Saitoella complicata NRRL Y-17804]|uniref:Uncharacterized protein n=1 Tax=Saitoella complicata (strain BCRC 22490 / CBS 7301 / JCM 7358 / NBRC 10748 / NRRL Y-17804) TaxID=698492 RepID=A0A0E9NM92_SAICN|nr:hypothetical protein G7K_5072-t1 [Saitoella complicata NRRL Y-17804]